MNKYVIEITTLSDRDMDDIFSYVSIDLKAPDTAAKLIVKMQHELQSLSYMPHRIPLSRDSYLAKQGFRVLKIDNYLAFFVIDETLNRVIIHRVMYGRRNYVNQFLSENADWSETKY